MNNARLFRMFDYDLWANRLWIEVVARSPHNERLHAIMDHILTSQEIWLNRVGMPQDPDARNLPLLQRAEANAAAWKTVLKKSNADERIAYKNLAGEPFESVLSDIAIHVANHGTYHRGQMREHAESLAIEFPETDFIRFARQFGS